MPNKPSPIAPELYDSWEALILTGQIAQENVPAILDGDPAFADWYRARAAQRNRSSSGGGD